MGGRGARTVGEPHLDLPVRRQPRPQLQRGGVALDRLGVLAEQLRLPVAGPRRAETHVRRPSQCRDSETW